MRAYFGYLGNRTLNCHCCCISVLAAGISECASQILVTFRDELVTYVSGLASVRHRRQLFAALGRLNFSIIRFKKIKYNTKTLI